MNPLCDIPESSFLRYSLTSLEEQMESCATDLDADGWITASVVAAGEDMEPFDVRTRLPLLPRRSRLNFDEVGQRFCAELMEDRREREAVEVPGLSESRYFASGRTEDKPWPACYLFRRVSDSVIQGMVFVRCDGSPSFEMDRCQSVRSVLDKLSSEAALHDLSSRKIA